jgi:hypothetical protein
MTLFADPNPIPKKVQGMKIYMEPKDIRKMTKTKMIQQTNRKLTKLDNNLKKNPIKTEKKN